jgi:hypothetical protein
MMEAEMLDGTDMADKTDSGRHYLVIATLIVWALALVVAGALIGGYPMIAALVALLVVGGLALALGVRGAEIGFGLILLVAGGVWMLFWGVLTLHYGLGVGVEQRSIGYVEFGVEPAALAIFGAFTSLGLIPFFLGGGFIFGARPHAKPDRPELEEDRSHRAVMAVSVEVILVVAILVVAVFVTRNVFTFDPSECCSSVSNPPGP